jgi:hypothetical protein
MKKKKMKEKKQPLRCLGLISGLVDCKVSGMGDVWDWSAMFGTNQTKCVPKDV